MKVTGKELERYASELSEVELAGHYGKGYHASVKYLGISNTYRVYDHRDLVLTTTNANDAAEAFNSIRPRAAD